MKAYAEKEGLFTQPRRMLISSYFLDNTTIITPLLLFHFNLGLICRKIIAFCNTLQGSASTTLFSLQIKLKERDDNPNTNVVAGTMKLRANNSYGYQITYRSRYIVTKDLSDEKAHGGINHKTFKRLGYVNDQLYEAALVKSEIEHKEPTIVGIFVLQNAKLRMLELYYDVFDK